MLVVGGRYDNLRITDAYDVSHPPQPLIVLQPATFDEYIEDVKSNHEGISLEEILTTLPPPPYYFYRVSLD